MHWTNQLKFLREVVQSLITEDSNQLFTIISDSEISSIDLQLILSKINTCDTSYVQISDCIRDIESMLIRCFLKYAPESMEVHEGMRLQTIYREKMLNFPSEEVVLIEYALCNSTDDIQETESSEAIDLRREVEKRKRLNEAMESYRQLYPERKSVKLEEMATDWRGFVDRQFKIQNEEDARNGWSTSSSAVSSNEVLEVSASQGQTYFSLFDDPVKQQSDFH